MTNVLLLIKGLGRGGAEQILVGSVRYGDRARFRYDVAYLLPWKDALVGALGNLDVTARCLGGARDARWAHRLRGLVRERGIDLVHVHSPYPAAIARSTLPRSLPIVYTEHNVWERYHPATRWANLFTYRRNDHVFAVSDHVRDSIAYPKALSFVHLPTIETLYHGPDPEALAVGPIEDDVREEFGIPVGAPIVGTVANLKPHKGYAQLLEAAVDVRRYVPDVRFVLVGQGPLEQQLRRHADALGLGSTVIFTGYREDVPRIARAFDVFVLASIHEGLALALIEAMALGKPAVVTRVGGLPEVVEDGVHGFVVPPGNAPELSRRIVTLLRDTSLHASFADAARRRAHAFSIETAARRIEEVYGELTA